MKPHLFNSNIADQNSYLFTSGNEAVVVDPGFNGETLLNFIASRNLSVVKVLITHGHYDHIRDIRLLQKLHKFTLYIHELDFPHLSDVKLSYATHYGGSFQLTKDQEVVLLKDNDTINFHDDVVKVIHTPGHTGGSVCFLMSPYLFSGDTLFKGSTGRTDLATGSAKQIGESIVKLFKLVDKEIYVYPGHEKQTTLSEERKNNTSIHTYLKHR